MHRQVVGESGLGKTTFLHKLLRRYGNVPISPAKRIEKTITISEVGRFDASDDLVRCQLDFHASDAFSKEIAPTSRRATSV